MLWQSKGDAPTRHQMNRPTQWNIGLPPWIIQDSNYKDFYVGQIAEFALEIYPKTLTQSDSVEIVAEPSDTTTYKVNAQVVFVVQKVGVIDFGIRGYCSSHNLKPFYTEGAFLGGEIRLGIDPFFYYERHIKLPGIPPIMYTWQIDRINLHRWGAIETVDEKGHGHIITDESKYIIEEVTKTDAWGDKRKNLEYPLYGYNLHCTKLDIEPKFRKST